MAEMNNDDVLDIANTSMDVYRALLKLANTNTIEFGKKYYVNDNIIWENKFKNINLLPVPIYDFRQIGIYIRTKDRRKSKFKDKHLYTLGILKESIALNIIQAHLENDVGLLRRFIFNQSFMKDKNKFYPALYKVQALPGAWRYKHVNLLEFLSDSNIDLKFSNEFLYSINSFSS